MTCAHYWKSEADRWKAEAERILDLWSGRAMNSLDRIGVLQDRVHALEMELIRRGINPTEVK